MSNYVRMYAVPKEKYDAFLSGACKGDIKYTRQINQLDVNDGGKVIIRNDDNNKRTTNVSRNVASPPSDKPENHSTFETKSENDDHAGAVSDNLDFDNLEERLRRLKNPHGDETPQDYNERLASIRKTYKLPDPVIPSNTAPILPSDPEFLNKHTDNKSTRINGPTNSIKETEKKFVSFSPEIPPNYETTEVTPPMRVTSENPPRVFTPISQLNSSTVNQFPALSHQIQTIHNSPEPISSMIVDEDFGQRLNALPDEFFYRSPIRDYKDVIDELNWASNTDKLSDDIFDSPMEDLNAPSNSKSSKKISYKRDAGLRHNFKSPKSRSPKNSRSKTLLNVLKASKPIRNKITPNNGSRSEAMEIAPSYRSIINNAEPSSGVSDDMHDFPGTAMETQEIKSVKLPTNWQTLIKKKRRNLASSRAESPDERRAARLERQSEFNERRGPRAIQNVSDIPQKEKKALSLVSVKRTPRSHARSLEGKNLARAEKLAEVNERRGPRVSDKNTMSESPRQTRSSNRELVKSGTNATLAPHKVRVKIGEPQEEMVSIIKKPKKSIRKRDHSPEMQVVFTKTQPVKRKKDDSEEDDTASVDSDGDYKMWWRPKK